MSSNKTLTNARKNKKTTTNVAKTEPCTINNNQRVQRKALSTKKVLTISSSNNNQRKQSQEVPLLTVNTNAQIKQSSPNKGILSKLECNPRYSFTNETSPCSPHNIITTGSCGDNFRKNCFSSKIVTTSSSIKKNANLLLQSPDDNNNNNNDITPFNINNNNNNDSVKLIDKSKNKKQNKTSHQPYLTEQLYINHANSSDDDDASNDSDTNNNEGTLSYSPHHKFTTNDIKNKGFAVSEGGTDEKGNDKINQDCFLIENCIFGLNYQLFGVMDGHGSYGHYISQYIKQYITDFFTKEDTYLKDVLPHHNTDQPHTKHSTHSNSSKTLTLKPKLDEKQIYTKLTAHKYQLLHSFISKLDNDLLTNSHNKDFNVHFSGSTCVLLFKPQHKLICLNIGDSKCILIKSFPYNTNKFKYIPLSNDHKPINTTERARIEKNGGTIAQYKDPEKGYDGPMRVWVKGEDYPGLAVSRSLGDAVAKTVGVISEPNIIEMDLTGDDKCVVIASDGVWDYLNEENVIGIVSGFLTKCDPQGAADEIVDQAIAKWEQNGVERDDITVIVVFLGFGLGSVVKESLGGKCNSNNNNNKNKGSSNKKNAFRKMSNA